jgi:chromosomal replication initiator protein
MSSTHTFESFVTGPANRFARSAALAVAESRAAAYNPLFIYGHAGLGKTHLLHAIANHLSERSPGPSVRYVTSETFVNDLIEGLRHRRPARFAQRYRTYDVLLVDDIQFFADKERIQEELFRTFDSLQADGRQVVLGSSSPPRDLAALDVRLHSRFERALVTFVRRPDLETRIAVLARKVERDRIEIADAEVLTYVATRATKNIRELEGALNRVVALARLGGQPVNRAAAEIALRDRGASR